MNRRLSISVYLVTCIAIGVCVFWASWPADSPHSEDDHSATQPQVAEEPDIPEDIRRAIADMESNEASVRIAAAQSLSKRYLPETRRWALWAMKDDPQEPEMALLSLADPDNELRRLAALRLSELRPPGITDRVFGVLDQFEGQTRRKTVRWLAAYLGATRDPRATLPVVAALFEAVEGSGGHFVLEPAPIRALAELNDPRAIDPLLERVDDPSRDVRLAAIHGLMQIDHPRAKEVFKRAWDGPESPLPSDLRELFREIERKEQRWDGS